ncbi:MAG TPA: DUF433 domain-containing protein [Saprospiraceae bacterium]|nr:DUF433 domain-containing protein [Saprospiraceae bacterium]
MDWKAHIHSNDQILGGKPVFKDTRLSVELVLERLADGWTLEQLYESYPRLTPEHIQALFAYLHDLAKDALIFNLTYSKAS